MRTLRRAARLGVSGAVILLVAGAAPAIAQDEVAEPVASETTPPPLVWVTGTADCPTTNPGASTVDEQGVRRYRAGVFTCRMDTSDPRVSGTHTTTTWGADVWEGAPALLVQWADVRLENEGGAWEGRLSGVASLPEPGDIIIIWYQGTGDYAGLSYFEQWTGNGPWTVEGLIFTGEPPALEPPAAD